MRAEATMKKTLIPAIVLSSMLLAAAPANANSCAPGPPKEIFYHAVPVVGHVRILYQYCSDVLDEGASPYPDATGLTFIIRTILLQAPCLLFFVAPIPVLPFVAHPDPEYGRNGEDIWTGPGPNWVFAGTC
jgi:hypothetical protein